MESKTIKVKASVLDPSTTVIVNVNIPIDIWDKTVEWLADMISDEMENWEDVDYSQAGGYIDYDGHSHDGSPEQSRVAFFLTLFPVTVGGFLAACEALGTLRDAMVKELETSQSEKTKEIALLKSLTALEPAMLNEDDAHWLMAEKGLDEWEDEDKQICYIHCEYPTELLDELAIKTQE